MSDATKRGSGTLGQQQHPLAMHRLALPPTQPPTHLSQLPERSSGPQGLSSAFTTIPSSRIFVTYRVAGAVQGNTVGH